MTDDCLGLGLRNGFIIASFPAILLHGLGRGEGVCGPRRCGEMAEAERRTKAAATPYPVSPVSRLALDLDSRFHPPGSAATNKTGGVRQARPVTAAPNAAVGRCCSICIRHELGIWPIEAPLAAGMSTATARPFAGLPYYTCPVSCRVCVCAHRSLLPCSPPACKLQHARVQPVRTLRQVTLAGGKCLHTCASPA